MPNLSQVDNKIVDLFLKFLNSQNSDPDLTLEKLQANFQSVEKLESPNECLGSITGKIFDHENFTISYHTIGDWIASAYYTSNNDGKRYHFTQAGPKPILEDDYQYQINLPIEEGLIEEGSYQGLYLDSILRCFRESSWDFPSACGALGIERTDGEEITMHPAFSEYQFINSLLESHRKLDPGDLNFDT